ncbi:MAG: glycosyltransferase [Planctomycetota bacterium]|nr:glycosyltransferase [Planctomycetota bacterium]
MGGLERCVSHLLNNLDRARFEPSLICLKRSGTAAQWLSRSDFPIVELNKPDRHDWRLPGRLSDVFRDLRLDIVHSHNWGTLLETALARRKVSGVRHIHAERGTVFGGSHPGMIKGWVNRYVLRWTLSTCDAVLAVSDDVAVRVVNASGFPANRIQVIPNGVAIPARAFVLGSVGRLAEVKRFDLAIRALGQLPGDAHLILVGEGPEQQRLESLAKELNLEQRVHFTGRQSAVGPWLAAMDVYINCSRSEGMSQSILEAMGFGLPEVVTDVGASRQLVGGDAGCGIVVPPDNVALLTDALTKLSQDSQLRDQFARLGPIRLARDYDLAAMIRKYESLYERLAEPRVKNPATRPVHGDGVDHGPGACGEMTEVNVQ